MFEIEIGVLLWTVVHLWKRVHPASRAAVSARIGDGPSKGIIALLLFASIYLMYRGYSSADFVSIYTPLAGMGHLNNLLMVFALFLMGAGSAKGRVASMIRHPMLSGVVVWSVAHLLVNGDLASLLLFGGLGLWAIVNMIVINMRVGPWDRPAPGPISGDIRAAVIGLVLLAIIAGIHIWLGHNPFMGTYA